jgi:hypothetical protein
MSNAACARSEKSELELNSGLIIASMVINRNEPQLCAIAQIEHIRSASRHLPPMRQTTELARSACRADRLLRNPPTGSPAGANPKNAIDIPLKPRSKTNPLDRI